jgi:hypothetical protein
MFVAHSFFPAPWWIQKVKLLIIWEIAAMIRQMPEAKQKPLAVIGIYLKGYHLDPDYISQVLQIQPSRSQKKGRLKAGSTRFVAKIGMWAIDVKSELRPISELIEELFQTIGNPPMRLDELEGVEDAHLDVFFAKDDENRGVETVEFALSQPQVARLGQLGLSVCVTVM